MIEQMIWLVDWFRNFFLMKLEKKVSKISWLNGWTITVVKNCTGGPQKNFSFQKYTRDKNNPNTEIR